MRTPMIFTSDNAIGANPEILEALGKVNEGFEPSYGNDEATDRASKLIKAAFEAPDASVCFVASGTAANALSLATLCPPWGAVLCHPQAHINNDECGAPEFYTNGAKLVEIEGTKGKIEKEKLSRAIKSLGAIGVHNIQKGALSLTNLTEQGTRYSANETTQLCHIAKSEGIAVHLDGARFANALAGQKSASPADLSWRAGVDILVLGGTKNGLLMGEAVIIFDPKRAWEFELRRKRGGHLISKGRYLGAQFEAYLQNDNWLKWADHANNMMRILTEGLHKKSVPILNDVEGNIAFVEFPRELHQELIAHGAEYYLDPGHQSLEGSGEDALRARLVTSWKTSEEEIEAFLSFF